MSDNLVGEQLFSSPEVENHLNTLVSDIQKFSDQIETVRPPSPELAEKAKQTVDQIGQNRGRPLFYPYVGTGVGRGCYVEVNDGSVKMDLINGIRRQKTFI